MIPLGGVGYPVALVDRIQFATLMVPTVTIHLAALRERHLFPELLYNRCVQYFMISRSHVGMIDYIWHGQKLNRRSNEDHRLYLSILDTRPIMVFVSADKIISEWNLKIFRFYFGELQFCPEVRAPIIVEWNVNVLKILEVCTGHI